MGYHFYNPYENKVSVARYARFFENSLKFTRSSGSLTLLKESESNVGISGSIDDVARLFFNVGLNSQLLRLLVLENPSKLLNQSVATPLKKTVALESTNQKPRSTIRKLYEHVSKTCSWWYPQITPPGYKWEPKSKSRNVNTNVSMPLGIKSRTTNISKPKTVRGPTLSNTPLSSNSFAARRDNSIHRRLWVLKAHDGKS
ncbi:hypothetical protein Tco_1265538 [Tanacetum coccineum]